MIFTNSLQQGRLPKIWKKANITPLYKKGNKSNPLNYRPVSLTSVICKILEILIREEWVEMLEKQNMLSGKQFGFRQGTVDHVYPIYYVSTIGSPTQSKK